VPRLSGLSGLSGPIQALSLSHTPEGKQAVEGGVGAGEGGVGEARKRYKEEGEIGGGEGGVGWKEGVRHGEERREGGENRRSVCRVGGVA